MEDNCEANPKREQLVKMKVVVRVRPFFARELQMSSRNVIEMSDKTITITDPEKNDSRQLVFDTCHWSHDGFIVNEDGVPVPDGPNSRFSGQEAMFQDIGISAMEEAWQGHNTAILAFGTTGSGKSYTMLGPSSDPGMVHRCCKHLFSEMASNPQNKYKLTFSLLEVHNERVIDLLSKSTNSLQIKQNPQGVFVTDLTEMTVKSAAQTEELLLQGLRNRNVAATRMNTTSSRSHLVVTFHFMQFITGNDGSRTKRHSRIRFVDMAGSERASKTGATGALLKEGSSINLSIGGLQSVISALASQKEGKRVFVPYRNTKLTRLLQEELGGNCATTIIANISPADMNYEETLSTLRFAHRAGMISKKMRTNDLDVDVAIQSWKAAIAEKEALLLSAETPEQKTELEKAIDTDELNIRQLEAPWLEGESKEKSGTWWASSVTLQQAEFDSKPYIQNISDDAQLSGVSKYIIPEGHSLAGNNEPEKVNIQLTGLGIQPWHAIFVNTGSSLSIAPCSSRATVHVNGKPINRATNLNHTDHIKLGACELFIVIGFPASRSAGNANAPKHNHEKCLTELAENHPLAQKLKPPASGNVRIQTAALLLFQEFTDLLPQVAQAHALAASFGKNIDFDVEVHQTQKVTDKFFIQVSDRELGMEWVWSKTKFEDRKLMMDQLYEKFLSKGNMPQLSQKNNPFYDAENLDIFLGRCLVSLHNIAHHLPVDDEVRVLDGNSKQVATLHVNITPFTSQGEPLQGRSPRLKDPEELSGKPLHLKCALPRFSDVLWAAANPQRGIYCKVWLEREKEALSTETVCGVVSGKFKNKFQFVFDEVTQNQLDFLQKQGLLLELWGTQTPCLSSPSTRPPSPPQPSPMKQPPQNTKQESQDSNTTSASATGLVLDLDLAQDIRKFFKDICPVQQRLQSLKKQADANSQAQEVRLQSWAGYFSQLQDLETQLNQSVVSLKESVKSAIQRSKST